MKTDHPVTLSDVLSVFTNMLPPKSDLLGTRSRDPRSFPIGQMEVKSLPTNLSGPMDGQPDGADEFDSHNATSEDGVSPAQSILPVPVLAEPPIEIATASGEARESNVKHASVGPKDSRGGQNTSKRLCDDPSAIPESWRHDLRQEVRELSAQYTTEVMGEPAEEEEPEPEMCPRCESEEVSDRETLCDSCNDELADGRWVYSQEAGAMIYE